VDKEYKTNKSNTFSKEDLKDNKEELRKDFYS